MAEEKKKQNVPALVAAIVMGAGGYAAGTLGVPDAIEGQSCEERVTQLETRIEEMRKREIVLNELVDVCGR